MAIKTVFPETIDDKVSRAQVDAWVDYSVESLNENADKLINALDRNSKSSSFLAWVGIVIAIVWAIMSWVWAWYTYLSYIAK